MKILFSTSSFGFLRNFQSTVRMLAERGHEVHLLAERGDTVEGQTMADALVAEHPGRISCSILPTSRHRLWYALGAGLRASLDYWRYLDPRWDNAPKLRARAESLAPKAARIIPRVPPFNTRAGLGALSRLFRAIDRALPPPPEVTELLERIRPDLLLLTPLLYFRSHQANHVRAARRLGIRSIVGIGSWDHLTTKGLLHEIPDRVLVWNEAQKREAVELHGVPADRVAVTGAQAFDHWFAARPSVDRETFFARVGLDPARPMLLYLCSSIFIAPYEVGFIRAWIAAIRSSADPWLRGAGLLVRPHPQNSEQWRGVDLAAEFENVALWPKVGVNPIGGSARADYFDSMFYSDAVVGVNTSGMIESGIIGRPVYAVQTSEFQSTQEGTLHFQHLKNVEGGLLHLSSDLPAHVEQLSRLRRDSEATQRKLRSFIQGFVRPHGLDVAATPRVVSEIEGLMAAAPIAASDPSASLSARLIRIILAPVAIIVTVSTMEREKLRAVVAHRLRPARLKLRALRSRVVYAARFVRRLPLHAWRLTRGAVRFILVRPVRWAISRGRGALHTVLTAGKDEPDQAA